MDLQLLSRRLFLTAHRWRRTLFACQGIAYGLGIYTSITHDWTNYSALLVGAVLTIGECCLWRHEVARGSAEDLRRRLDLWDAFGWPVSAQEHADLIAEHGPVELQSRERYFASGTPVGPKRAVENTYEAAWWSRHLTTSCYRITGSAFIILLIGSVLFLLIAIKNASNPNRGEQGIGKKSYAKPFLFYVRA